MRKFLLFAILSVLLLSISNKTFAVCSGATLAGALNPSNNWQTVAPNTHTYYTFVATYVGETFVFTFCDGGGSSSLDTQLEIYTSAGVAVAGFYNDDHCGLGSEIVFTAPTTGTFRIGIYRYYCAATTAGAGTMAYRRLPAPTSADCLGALPLCNINNSHPISASGEGNYYDLFDFHAQQGAAVNVNNCPNCLTTGEDNNMWYTFVAQTTGTVNFTIIPVNSSDDYDWAAFSLNNGVGCLDLVNFNVPASRPVLCNYCGSSGNTGAGSGSLTCEGPNSCSNYTSALNVIAGNTYVVNVSNFSASVNGYSINFGGSATIVDNTGPTITSLEYPPFCGQSSITLQFSERLWCGSVQPQDFILTGPGGTYAITDTWSAVCESAFASTYAGTFYDDLWTLELGDYLDQDGNYSICVITGGVLDICNNPSPGNCRNFVINGIEATVSRSNITCNGENDGSITVGTPTGGTAPYTLTWTGPTAIANNNYNPTNLPPGAYTITINDINGQCQFVQTVTISEPTAVGYNATITQPSCGGGGNDGSVLITGTGGAPNYNIQLGAATQNGVASYNFTGLTGNSYTVNITDATGCTGTGTVILNSVEVPDATFTYNGNQCFNGHSFNFTHTGTPIVGETYAWTFAGGTPATSTAQNPTGITWATAGTYTATLIITVGPCTHTYSQNITIYPQTSPTITPTQPSCGLCNGAAITTTAYSTYIWSNGGTGQSISSLCAGSYSVTVSDANSCTGTATTTLTNSGNVPVAIVVTTPPSCNGLCNGTAVVNATGCTTYAYNYSSGSTPNNQSTGGLCDGSYTVTVSDGSNPGCFTVENFTITEPPAMVLTMSATDATCGLLNGSASVVVTGHTPPPSYNWSNGPTSSAITVGSGSYTVTVTDGAGCTASNTVIIDDAGVPFTISTSVVNHVSCNGLCNGSATVTPVGAGPFTYLWDNSQITPTATGLCQGNHSVTVTMAGCNVVGTVNITQPTALTTTTINIVNANCGLSDGSITANPTGGTAPYVSHWWNTSPAQNSVTATGVPTGTYTVTVTDSHGCTATANGFVGNVAGPTVSISGTNISCNGGNNGAATATVTSGTPNYTYNWSNGFNQTIPGTTSNVSGLSSGAISVIVTDANGCTASNSATITQPTALNLSLISTVPVTCNGNCDGQAQVSVSGGTTPYSYNWSSGLDPNSPNNTNLCGGGHSVIVTDNHGCTANLAFNISEPPAMLLNITTTPATCGMPNGSATATPIGGTSPYGWSWSGGSNPNSQTNNGLTAAGSPYSVTITDNNGCSQTGTVTIVDIAAPTATISTTTNPSCNGNTNGSATVSASGGTPPYSYLWNTSPIQTSATAINLGAGPYFVTVTDASMCTVTATAILTNPAGLSLNLVSPPINCFGECTGSALANVTGGTLPYTYLWSNLQTTQTATGLCSGSYIVTVTDVNGCSIQDGTIINQQPDIAVSSAITPSNCGQSDGSIDITVGGGSPPYLFTWSDSQLSEDIWNIPAGAYTVTITDHKGCQKIVSYPISDQNAQVVSISGSTDATCYGTCNGTATASVTGGTGLFQFSWNSLPVQTSQTATNLCAGSYSVVVTDLTTGCIATSGVTIAQPTQVDLISGITGITCSSLCNGAIGITAFGGTVPYTYNWSGPGVSINAEDQSGLCAGIYSVAILDANNCYTTRNFTLTAPPFITVPIVSTPTDCFGSCTGTATAAPSGGTPPYTYLWSGSGQSTQTALSLCTGAHSVTVTDANGCTATNSVMLNTPTEMQFADITINNAQCNGSSNASISITITGGTPPYDYVWNNGQVISNPFGLASGQHCVTVIDNNDCTINTCVMIDQPPVLNVSLTATNELCNSACNGTINATPSGGVGPYTYLWTNGEVAQNINNLCAGVYNVTVTDFKGCQVYNSTSINSPAILDIAIQNIVQPTCGNNNGAITIGAIGGTGPYGYTWSPTPSSSSTLNNINSGNYTITVTDHNGCSTSETISLSDIDGPVITNIAKTDVDCFGNSTGTAEVFFTSPTVNNTIAWSNGQFTALAINLVEGAYIVTVTDGNGCSAVGNVVITQPQPLNATISSHSNITCFGLCNGSATALGTGGALPYTYSWSGGASAQTANGLCTGSQVITIIDNNGCQATANVTITEPPALTLSGVVTDTRCYAGSDGIITVTAGGGTGNYFYSWPSIPATSNVVTGLSAASYTVVIYDATDVSCFISNSYTVNEPPIIDAIFVTENATCGFDNGVAYIDNISGGTGSYNYHWNPGNMNSSYIDGLAAGDYSITITDGNGCTRDYSVSVDATNDLLLDNVLFNGVTCYGYNDGFAQLFVSGGSLPYTYNWTPNVADQSSSNSLIAGIYSVQVTDNDGCVVHTQFPISTPEDILVYPGEPRTICIGQEAIVTASASGGNGNYSFIWDGLGTGTAFIVNPESTTDYVVTAYDWKGCSSAPGSQMIEVHPPLSLSVITPEAICLGQVAVLTANASGGDGYYIYNWGNGQVTTSNILMISPIVDTDYTVILTDGCTTPGDTVTVTASVSEMPEIHITRTPYTGCSPLNVAFDNNTDNMTYSYYWEFDDFDSGTDNFSDLKRPNHVFEEMGFYKVLAVVSTPMGCKDSAFVQVNIHKGPIADFNAFPWSTGFFEPEIDFVDASDGALAWEWSFGDGGTSGAQNPTHTFMDQGEFPVTLVVASQQGCTDSITKNVNIIDDHRIYFPTAINLRSPGNDEFYPIGVGVDEENYQMTIYNRWGEMIFTTRDWNTHWKGRYSMDKGDYVPQGVYTYIVVLRDKYGKDYSYAGSVTVFK